MIDEASALSVAIGLGSVGIGMISLASAHAFRTMKSPKESNQELSEALDSLRAQLGKQRDEHFNLSTATAVLSAEVRHLGENVGRLASEVKILTNSPWTATKPAGRRA
jgi:hypothetical protein